jgi:DNA polymerase
MDDAASDELIGEVLDLTRRLRGQLARHAALGAWAAPGGASARIADAMGGDAEPQDAGAPPGAGSETPPDVPEQPAGLAAAHGATAAGARRHAGAAAGGRDAAAPPRPALATSATAPPSDPHVGAQTPGDLAAARTGDAPAAGGYPAAAEPRHAIAGAPGPHVAAQAPADLAGDAPVAPGRRTLPQVRTELGECTRCKLHSTRRSIVFGVGAPDTPLMFVGEAPGEQEDRRGEPFVGPAGQLLDKMIEAMGWTRAAVYIANTTKCRPPGNRNPQPDELAQCMPFLHGQIAAIAPRIIVALGRPAANQLLGTDAPISALRGRFHDYALPSDGVRLKIMPTFHPAYLLRDPSKKRTAWEDLKLVMAELERLGIASPAAPRG